VYWAALNQISKDAENNKIINARQDSCEFGFLICALFLKEHFLVWNQIYCLTPRLEPAGLNYGKPHAFQAQAAIQVWHNCTVRVLEFSLFESICSLYIKNALKRQKLQIQFSVIV